MISDKQLKPGLVSVTFRSLKTSHIIDLASSAGLSAIEWTGDIHVPPNNIRLAHETAQRTREAGLAVAGYGSYYRLGLDVTKQVDFNRVLESALGLGAPTIRVWAGGKNSIETSPEQRLAIIEDAVRIADLAAAANISISLEYHSGTLTDTASSVRNLLSEVTHPNIDFLWQPVPGETVADNLQRLDDVTPRLRYLHVFHWGPTDSQRLSLADGENSWRDYIAAVRRRNRPTWFLLEFVARDSIEQFQADAISLGSWLNQ